MQIDELDELDEQIPPGKEFSRELFFSIADEVSQWFMITGAFLVCGVIAATTIYAAAAIRTEEATLRCYSEAISHQAAGANLTEAGKLQTLNNCSLPSAYIKQQQQQRTRFLREFFPWYTNAAKP